MTAQLDPLEHTLAVVGVVTESRDIALIRGLLAEPSPSALTVVVWAMDFEPAATDLVPAFSAFRIQGARDGTALMPGVLYVLAPGCCAWFEGRILRVRAGSPEQVAAWSWSAAPIAHARSSMTTALAPACGVH